MNRALYTGSFDPFTIGHLSVLKQASELFEEVVVIKSQNPSKTPKYDEQLMYATMCYMNLYTWNGYDKSKVIILPPEYTNGCNLPSKLAKQLKCNYIVRGVRDNTDYDYEEKLAKFNDEYTKEVKTIYVRSENSVSSSMVNAFINNDVNVQNYLPYSIKYLFEDKLYDDRYHAIEENKKIVREWFDKIKLE